MRKSIIITAVCGLLFPPFSRAAAPMNVVILYADDWRFDTLEKYQEMMKNYYRLATEVDTTCGHVIEDLKKQGVLDHTLVIFVGDTGCFHVEADPFEENDLARDPAQSDRLADMRKRFNELKTSAK